MKKGIALLLLVLAAIAAPMGAMADDIRTPGQCADGATADDPTGFFLEGSAPGRGSFCLSDGDANNGNELYIGGDASQPCGHIEVLGQVVTEEGDETPAGFCH